MFFDLNVPVLRSSVQKDRSALLSQLFQRERGTRGCCCVLRSSLHVVGVLVLRLPTTQVIFSRWLSLASLVMFPEGAYADVRLSHESRRCGWLAYSRQQVSEHCLQLPTPTAAPSVADLVCTMHGHESTIKKVARNAASDSTEGERASMHFLVRSLRRTTAGSCAPECCN